MAFPPPHRPTDETSTEEIILSTGLVIRARSPSVRFRLQEEFLMKPV
jgi:hypothetical protein